MNESLLKRIMRSHKEQRRLIAVILCLSVVVSLGTVAALRQTGEAMTYTRRVLDCPYTVEGAETVAHRHNDDCLDEEGNLICTLLGAVTALLGAAALVVKRRKMS